MSPWFQDGKPVLITGGRGFLGSHLALRLAAAAPPGAIIHVVDDGTRDALSHLVPHPPGAIRTHRADIRQTRHWLSDLGPFSVVVHCAALAGVSTYYQRPHDVLAVNGFGTARLVEQLSLDPPALLVNLSTSEVYGGEADGAREDGPTAIGTIDDPRWTYATSKLYAESVVLHAHRAGALPAVSVRPFNIYGPGQVGEGAVRNFAEAAVRGEALRVTGVGSAVRSWCYVEDFCDAVFALAASPTSWGRTYNVGHPGTRISMRGLAERIRDLAGSTSVIEAVPHPGRDIALRWPRIDRIQDAVGWSPRVVLDEGLQATLAHWRAAVARTG